jgi:hypothetical protein
MYDATPTRYSFGIHDFGAGSEEFSVKGPKGKKGLLVDYGVLSPVQTFTATTTAATVAIGTTADPDAYGDELSLGTLADKAGAKSVLTDTRPGTTAYDALMLNRSLPADTAVVVTCTAPTGGTPAGKAVPFVDIVWEL